jgi:hypothetical protein
MCEADLPTMFWNSLWISSSLVKQFLFTGRTDKNCVRSEDGIHREFRNIVGKLASHIVQKPQKRETIIIGDNYQILLDQ